MKRRDVIKGMGLSMGYALAAPTALSLLQSCITDPDHWTPSFISTDHGIVIKNLVDVLLPVSNDSPGALDVNVPQFLDLYFGKVLDVEGQTKFTNGITAASEELLKTNEASLISDLRVEDYDKILSKYLRTTKEERVLLSKENNIVFDAISNLRKLSVWAFTTSEEIGEKVLAYDPIPESQKGCISLEESTGGKKWSP